MDLLFELLPRLVWLFIVTRVIRIATKNARRGKKRTTARTQQQRVQRLSNANPANSANGPAKWDTGSRKLANQAKSYKPQNPAKTELSGRGSFRDAGFDDYSSASHSQRVKTTTGYNRKLATDEHAMRHSANMQYSHTYDGHEPWDKCMPKEKDPWDKDFYAED